MTLDIKIAKILLFPPTFFLGIFVGMIAGAVSLPYFVFQELMRRGEAKFKYLHGWNAWAENWSKPGKIGWYVIWVLWIGFWFASAISWAPFVGAVLGATFVIYALFVPDGTERARALTRRSVERIRNTKIEIRFRESEVETSR